jgi:hypothetical protein
MHLSLTVHNILIYAGRIYGDTHEGLNRQQLVKVRLFFFRVRVDDTLPLTPYHCTNINFYRSLSGFAMISAQLTTMLRSPTAKQP